MAQKVNPISTRLNTNKTFNFYGVDKSNLKELQAVHFLNTLLSRMDYQTHSSQFMQLQGIIGFRSLRHKCKPTKLLYKPQKSPNKSPLHKILGAFLDLQSFIKTQSSLSLKTNWLNPPASSMQSNPPRLVTSRVFDTMMQDLKQTHGLLKKSVSSAHDATSYKNPPLEVFKTSPSSFLNLYSKEMQLYCAKSMYKRSQRQFRSSLPKIHTEKDLLSLLTSFRFKVKWRNRNNPSSQIFINSTHAKMNLHLWVGTSPLLETLSFQKKPLLARYDTKLDQDKKKKQLFPPIKKKYALR